MRPPLTYYGGKQKMASSIIKLIPAHGTYVESFAGSAAVFWKKEKSPVEILNDINGDIMNFYEVAKKKPYKLAEMNVNTPNSRRVHDYAIMVLNMPEFHSKLKRAWAIWYLCNKSFSGKLGNTWAFQTKPYDNRDCSSISFSNRRLEQSNVDYIQAMIDRLDTTQLECRDALYVIKNRDHELAFHYIDPPYIYTDQGHYGGFMKPDYDNLLSLLTQLKGNFILSCFPSDILMDYVEANKWILRSYQRNLSASRSVDGKRPGKKEECLVMNYIPPSVVK